MNNNNDLRKEFEQLMQDRCVDNSCEIEEDTYDYPDYVEAFQKEVMPPLKSGIYFSRWDLKQIGDVIDASIAMDARERMFKMLMRSIHNRTTMEGLLNGFKALIDPRIESYEKIVELYPSSAFAFEEKIENARKTKVYFEEILETYFPEGETL